jgi:hypothetical protein
MEKQPGGHLPARIRNMRTIAALLASTILGSCATADTGGKWHRIDGLPIGRDPARLQKAQTDLLVCQGERAKVIASGTALGAALVLPVGREQPMPIYRILEGAAFDPEAVKALTAAYEATCAKPSG